MSSKNLQKTHYKAIIFDIDGTILDTINDIKNAINISIKEEGYDANYSSNDIKCMLGHGAVYLWTMATKPYNFSKEQLDKSFANYMKHYALEQGKTTHPFDGEVELLTKLRDSGHVVAIYSNKPHQLALEIIEQTYGLKMFDEVIGKREGYEPKPNPSGILEIIEKHGLKKDKVLYVGDSYPDVLTAKNAGVDVAILTTGYGRYQDEWVKEANYLFKSINELTDFLLK